MAEPNIEASEEGAPKSKKKLIIISIILLLLIIGSAGGGAWYFFIRKPPDAQAVEQAKQKEEEKKRHEEEMKPPVIVAMDPLTVNVLPAKLDRYLQIALSLKFKSPKEAEEVKPYLPEIRHSLLVLMTGQNADALQTIEGKDTLRADIEQRIREVLPKEKFETFKEVLFTTFVIQ